MSGLLGYCFQDCSLLIPPNRKGPHNSLEHEIGWVLPVEDFGDDIRRQKGQSQNAPRIGLIDAFCLWQFCDWRKCAALDHAREWGLGKYRRKCQSARAEHLSLDATSLSVAYDRSY